MSGNGGLHPAHSFTDEARANLLNRQLRTNLNHATHAIRDKRLRAIAEIPEWEELRKQGAAIKDGALANLAENLTNLEKAVQQAGGQVHWARDAAEARLIVIDLVKRHDANEVVKVKSLTTDEIELNKGLEENGIHPIETDLAELICQLAGDSPSHILVPAIHKNRTEIQALFREKLGADLPTDDPAALAEAARTYLRHKFLTTKVAISGANFAIAETGTVCVFESEGNGRMCLTLPEVLITVMGIEKVLPRWEDIAVFLRLLPRSSTAERMNPYTSFWTGVHAGDGPKEFHLVLLDNGRTAVLASNVGRQTLRCIRCSACLNVCPVYERTGGHSYGSVYPGPIGAILTPQLLAMKDQNANTLPYASSLCGACLEACPVRIDIPEVLIHLRGETRKPWFERLVMRRIASAMSGPKQFLRAIKTARLGQKPFARNGIIHKAPGMKGWTASRDLPALPSESFREWWSGSKSSEECRTPGFSRLPQPTNSHPAPAHPNPLPGRGEGTGAKSEILARIEAAALESRGAGVSPAPERPRRSRSGIVAQFCEYARDYKATVTQVDESGISSALAGLIGKGARAAVPQGFPASLIPNSASVRTDDGLSHAELDKVETVITLCAFAIAETGTIVLDGGAGQGGRAVTLIPDHHICIVRSDQIVDSVDEAVKRLAESIRQSHPLTWISGPSATSDIELVRVEGVHGPRRLDIILIR